MTGNIRKRKTTKGVAYQLTIDKGINPLNGKRIREYFSFSTKKQAEQKRAEMIDQLNKGTYIEPCKLTVKQICEQWLATYAEPQLARSTVRGYKVNFYNHTFPYIGQIPLQKLIPTQIQELYSKLEEKGLGARSIKYVHTTLREALNYAYRMGLIPRNPADFCSSPKQQRYHAVVYDENEVLELMNKVASTELEVPVTLGVGLGLRRGEILALKWSDIDFKTNTVTIQRNLICLKNEVLFLTPKTQSSNRKISLSNYVVDLLKTHRIAQAKNRFALDNAYENNDLICCKDDGTPYNTSSFSLKFKRFLAKNKLKHIRFHDLRHTCATLMLKYNIPAKVASQRLGHSSIAITLDTYSHVLKEVEQEVAIKFDENLFNKFKLG